MAIAQAQNPVIAPGAKVRKLAGGFKFTEGPACDRAGNVYFTDQPNDRILKWSTDGLLSTFKQGCGRANGMFFDKKGDLWTCSDEQDELWRITPAGVVEVVVKDFQGRRLNGPNDLWIRPDGGIYLTDPYYQRDYWQRKKSEIDGECVYYLAPDHQRLIRVADDLEKPNGIIGTPDGKLLYVADIGAGKTYRYAMQPDGSLSQKTLFCEQGSDGMTIDDRGNLYLTGDFVSVYDSSGKKIAQIDPPEPGWVGNLCFGGKDRRTLFLTASEHLFALDMAVAGADWK